MQDKQPLKSPLERNFETDYKWWEDLEKKTKLEQAFAIGCNDREACSYAEISVDQLYYYTREVNPQFQAKKEELKDKPLLKARQTLVKSLDDPLNAKWYLERKAKKEFGNSLDLGGEGMKIIFDQVFNKNVTTPTTETDSPVKSEVQDSESGTEGRKDTAGS